LQCDSHDGNNKLERYWFCVLCNYWKF